MYSARDTNRIVELTNSFNCSYRKSESWNWQTISTLNNFKSLITPKKLKEEFPATDQVAQLVADSRNLIQGILRNRNDRRIVIVGPCSLHDGKATLEYAGRLRALQDEVDKRILIIMRAYFEKPRTTLGWKGMIYDPHLDNSYNIEEGLQATTCGVLGCCRANTPRQSTDCRGYAGKLSERR